jgi:hypothetical protein
MLGAASTGIWRDRRRGLLLAACALGAGSLPARAQSVPASLLTCATEVDDARRLACYDRDMARELAHQVSQPQTGSPPPNPEAEFGLTARVRRKPVEEPASERPAMLRKLVAAVAKVSSNAAGRAVFELANGQVWEQTQDVAGFYLNSSDSVTITAGALKSYWASVDSRPPVRVRRVR